MKQVWMEGYRDQWWGFYGNEMGFGTTTVILGRRKGMGFDEERVGKERMNGMDG